MSADPPSAPPSGDAPPPPAPPATSPESAPTGPPQGASPADQPNIPLLVLKDKVQRYLSDMGVVVEVLQDGDFSFRYGSARVFISCWTRPGSDRTMVTITAPVLIGCKATPELYEHVALHGSEWIYGHLSLQKTQAEGEVNVLFSHILMGDFLDPEELKQSVGALVTSADGLDDELQARFGGKRFHEEST